MRIILDTNVWVSGLLIPHSNAGKIIEEWKHERFDLIVFPYLLEEIQTVLAYPKIQKRLKWDHSQIQHYIDFLAFFAEMVEVNEISKVVPTDPKDSPFLSALVITKADFLISRDSDLLNLKEQYPILSGTEFLQKLER